MIGNTILRVLTATLTGHGPHLEQVSKKPRGLTTVSHLPQRLLYRMQKGATWMFFFEAVSSKFSGRRGSISSQNSNPDRMCGWRTV